MSLCLGVSHDIHIKVPLPHHCNQPKDHGIIAVDHSWFMFKWKYKECYRDDYCSIKVHEWISEGSTENYKLHMFGGIRPSEKLSDTEHWYVTKMHPCNFPNPQSADIRQKIIVADSGRYLDCYSDTQRLPFQSNLISQYWSIMRSLGSDICWGGYLEY